MACMRKFLFEPRRVPVISGFEALNVLNSISRSSLSKINLTLGKYKDTPVSHLNGAVVFEWVYRDIGRVRIELSIEKLINLSRKEYRVFTINPDNSVQHLGLFSDNAYYQLIAIDSRKAPTIEINGIRMHRTKDLSPFEDARLKIHALRLRPGMRILDICTGLGYTAIWALKSGGQVTTIEKDENVLRLAEFNPWSEELSNTDIIIGDASKIINEFSDHIYDRVINDPPRFSVAGELYSLSFFKEIYRVLKPKGFFFQYTGFPQSRYRGKSIVKGIGERLRMAGFMIKFKAREGGYLCYKP